MATPTAPVDPWTELDRAYQEVMDASPEDRRWLLVQTLATAVGRRALQQSLPIPAGATVIDVGCGYGASSIELALLRPARVTGIDLDAEVLEVARSVAARVEPLLPAGSEVGFVDGDAYRLPADDASVDVAFSRFVFQHLDDPARAAGEIHRVLRPGGLACVVDVDDGLSISEPPPSEAFTALADALTASQAGRGGDRRVGRRLAGLLDSNGFEPAAVIVLPQAAYLTPAPGDPAAALMRQRLLAARPGIVSGGHMAADEFDRRLEEFAAETPVPRCEIEGHLAVVARRRA